MIPANELQPGNYVVIDAKLCQLTKDTLELGATNGYPVVLAPELLQLCDSFSYAKGDWISSLQVNGVPFNFCFKRGRQLYINDLEILPSPKYLHEFQNLFYNLVEAPLVIDFSSNSMHSKPQVTEHARK